MHSFNVNNDNTFVLLKLIGSLVKKKEDIFRAIIFVDCHSLDLSQAIEKY